MGEIIISIVLWCIVIALLTFGGIAGFVCGIAWISAGAWMVSRTPSRGTAADLSFVVMWPVYVALGR